MQRPFAMPRALAATAVTLVLTGALAIGIVLLATGDGATAFTVDGRSTSQASIDDELRALSQNTALTKVQNGQSLMTTNGSVSNDLAAGWVGLVIGLEAAARDTAQRGELISEADRAAGKVLATQSVVDRSVFDAFPSWFRTRLIARWAPIAASARALIASDRSSLVTAARADCSSGRFVARIVVPTMAQANTLKQQLVGGADFVTLATQQSVDQASGIDGGDLGCLDNQNLDQQVAAVATSQPIGVVSDPVQTTSGVTLILVRNDPADSTLRGFAINQILSTTRATVEVDPRYGSWNAKLRRVDPHPVPGAPISPGG